jgi:predicted dehydrogenase
MIRPVRIVLFGNSYAEKVQLPALAQVGGNQVVGLAGKDEAKARASAERWKIPHATANWPELFDLEPDLVLVSTPVDLHFDMVRNALEQGCAVLCEKPFTLDVAQAEELAVLAEGKLALIDHQLRWNPLRRELRVRVRAGFVGRVLHVRTDLVLDSPGFLTRPRSWWFDEARGGGVLGALGSHLVDYLLWTFGPIEAVQARLETFVRQRPGPQGRALDVTSDDFAELWLRLASGACVSLTTSVVQPGSARWLTEVSGSEGSLRLEGEETLVGGRHGEELRTLEPAPGCAALGPAPGGAFAACEPLFLADVVAAVARGESTLAEAATFADGLACMRVLAAARESSRLGGGWLPCR